MNNPLLSIVSCLGLLLLSYCVSAQSQTPLAQGHQQLRNILGIDIGKMKFDTPELIALRKYLYNSLLTSNSNSYSSGSYNQSSAKILFCPDGSFTQVLSGMVSLNVDGASAYSGGSDPSDIIIGIWEVAVAENMYFILFYSTDTSMLQDSPNGFLPLPIADYQDDILLLPGGNHYRRWLVGDCGF